MIKINLLKATGKKPFGDYIIDSFLGWLINPLANAYLQKQKERQSENENQENQDPMGNLKNLEYKIDRKEYKGI